MSDRISLGDIQAFESVLDIIGEQSDDYDLDHAAALIDALGTMKRKLDETVGLLKTQVRKSLDGQTAATTADGLKVKSSPNRKKRPDHDRIRHLVVQRSLRDENGERLALPQAAAEQAVDIMYDLFVAPASEPKADGLTRLGVKKADVTTEEITSYNVEVTRE